MNLKELNTPNFILYGGAAGDPPKIQKTSDFLFGKTSFVSDQEVESEMKLPIHALSTELRQSKTVSFLRDFAVYLGPALIVSVAYMDPGNYGTDLAAGGEFKYGLVWAVWLASIMAMLLQYLSGKLGIATGKDLAEHVHDSLRKNTLVIPYWLGAEIAAAATDLAEYLGTVIALNLLFGVPLIYASIFGAFDVLILMALATKKFRMIEQFFMLLVSIIGFGFLYESILIGPDPAQILYHTLVPSVSGGASISDGILLVVGIIGATVMPHALFVHSSLTKEKIKTESIEEKRRTRKLHLAENVLLLGIAGVINVAILLFSTPLYPSVGLTIQGAFDKMGSTLGLFAADIFVITLLCSGLTSSVTGTLAGQKIMEGLVGRKVKPWTRRIVTRFVNVVPTTIAILIHVDLLSLLVYSQVILSLLIPLPMIPLIYYTSKKKFMGEFVNRNVTLILAALVAGIIIIFNLFLLATV